MSRKALRCVVEIDIHTVTSPGTWLMSHNDVYLSICLFGQIQKTVLAASIFPIIFYDKLKFEKVFYTAYDPARVSDALEEILVHVDLMQISNDGSGARLLAWYNSTALQFLYPSPVYFPRYGLHNQEVLMERSVLFPGISPKLEFSTRTVIQETPNVQLDPWQRDFLPSRGCSRHSRQKKSTAVRGVHQSRCSCHSVPLDAAHRCRSVSPRICAHVKDISLEDDDDDTAAGRPAFVVRKVGEDLIGRRPGVDRPLSPSSRASTAKKSVSADVLQCSCHVQSCTICQAFQRYLGKSYHRHSCCCCCIHLKHLPGCSGNYSEQDPSSTQGERENVLLVKEKSSSRISGSKVIHTVNNVSKENKESDNWFNSGSKLRKRSLDQKKSGKSSHRRE